MLGISAIQAVAIVALFILAWTVILSSARLISIIQPVRGPAPPIRRDETTHLLVVLGSGGHSAEMLAMPESVDMHSYTHRTYVVSEGDPISAQRAANLEEGWKSRLHREEGGKVKGKRDRTKQTWDYSYTIWTIPRARKIHQSILTTPISGLRTLLSILKHLRCADGVPRQVPPAPNIILANGPATSAIVIFASLILRILDLSNKSHAHTRIVFIESFARVKTLSLSAKCIGLFVDRLVVQWQGLKSPRFLKLEYGGPLVVNSLLHSRS